MRRAWPVWIAFAFCLAIVAAAMGWISLAALRLDEAEARARHQAAVEEDVRLALWRIDSAISPLLAQESARPYIAYKTLVPEGPVAAGRNAPAAQVVSAPPPDATSPFVLVHFQFEPDGRITSPESFNPEATSAAKSRSPQHRQLDRIAALTDRRRLSALLPPDSAAGAHLVFAAPRPAAASRPAARPAAVARSNRGATEYQMRSQSITMNNAAMVESQYANNLSNYSQWNGQLRNGAPTMGNGNVAVPQAPYGANFAAPSASESRSSRAIAQPAGPEPRADDTLPVPSPSEMGGGLMTPLWIDGQLLLARRITVAGRDYLQGCLLDWPAAKAWLLESVSDLLPQADLVPVAHDGAEDQSRMLAGLPLRLVSGPSPPAPEPASPLRWILPVAWLCVLLAATAVAALLAGVIRLGQRRADFVSAVTHELRTPLTTFHMYTEMLSEGMVPDPQQQQGYFDTLRAEASRLSHLVENVLAYARLERRRTNDVGPVTAGKLLECRCRLADRARQAGMNLTVEASDAALSATVRTNPSIVEQILFNLVDNACKYASAGEDKGIRIVVEPDDRGVRLSVCDRGPGLPKAVARKLFRAFAKSGQEAANSAPGIGLGLALSKRLARDIGGRLSHDPGTEQGATFVLSLPRA